MVAEEEGPLCAILKYSLEAEGYQVEIVNRGDDAEIRLRENLPDLLVLDWMLPGVWASNFAGGCACAPRPSDCRSSC